LRCYTVLQLSVRLRFGFCRPLMSLIHVDIGDCILVRYRLGRIRNRVLLAKDVRLIHLAGYHRAVQFLPEFGRFVHRQVCSQPCWCLRGPSERTPELGVAAWGRWSCGKSCIALEDWLVRTEKTAW
jgi:hypothetical protein